jgi:hypothetical protein
MKHTSTLLAVLLVTGLFGVPALFADGGGGYSEPPIVEEGTVVLADGGGDRGGQPVEEARDIALVQGRGEGRHLESMG